MTTDSAAAASADTEGFTSAFVSAPDGLRLHLRIYGAHGARHLPVVCLPGLARTGADFHELATTLAGDAARPRRVLALDYRGRGGSDYDRDPANYALPVELADVLAVLTAHGIDRAVMVGTSRGGLLSMLMAAVRPTALAGVVLNDIGPVIDPRGLVRIKSYVGKLPRPRSFEEGAEILRRLGDQQFPALAPDDWLRQAHRTWKKAKGRFELVYDPKLARTLAGFDPAQPLPDLWPQFDALAAVPVMAIRGATSDILSAETVAAMRARRPDLVDREVPGQGHAPLLTDAATIATVAAFVARCDAPAHG